MADSIELALTGTCQRGAVGDDARRVQEWLCLQDLSVAIDGEFGPATEAAVREFQSRVGLPINGAVDATVFTRLTGPMRAALQPIAAAGQRLGALVVGYAQQHLAQHPREVGGQNRGPWVRLYMSGREGADWPWCAGFACFCLRQACETLGVELPIRPSVSCDSLAASARERGVFVPEADPQRAAKVGAGSFFLVRRTDTDWTHTGIVVSTNGDAFRTIEGNTNDEGSREGYEVCARIRGFENRDFIHI